MSVPTETPDPIQVAKDAAVSAVADLIAADEIRLVELREQRRVADRVKADSYMAWAELDREVRALETTVSTRRRLRDQVGKSRIAIPKNGACIA